MYTDAIIYTQIDYILYYKFIIRNTITDFTFLPRSINIIISI